MGRIAVVTDSTADIPPEVAEQLGLRVVPMTVTVGGRAYLSRYEISDEEFYALLRRGGELPTTAQPAPAWFEEAYADAADEGAGGVVSIHLSGELSGTCAVARTVAGRAPLPVRVVDSRQVSGGLLLVVLAALRAAEQGGDLDAVAAAAETAARHVRMFFAVDTLEFLRRGGRLSGTQAAVGSVLRVKPVLTVRDGRVELLERVRTWTRAVQRLVELAVAHADGGPAAVAVSHGLAPERAEAVADALAGHLELTDRWVVTIGPVVATHAGPGAVGVAVLPHHRERPSTASA